MVVDVLSFSLKLRVDQLSHRTMPIIDDRGDGWTQRRWGHLGPLQQLPIQEKVGCLRTMFETSRFRSFVRIPRLVCEGASRSTILLLLLLISFPNVDKQLH